MPWIFWEKVLLTSKFFNSGFSLVSILPIRLPIWAYNYKEKTMILYSKTLAMIQYTPNCLGHQNCIKMDLKCLSIVYNCLHIQDDMFMIDHKPKMTTWLYTRAKILIFSKCQNLDQNWGGKKKIFQIQPDPNETCL